jgi:hypothetical protein
MPARAGSIVDLDQVCAGSVACPGGAPRTGASRSARNSNVGVDRDQCASRKAAFRDVFAKISANFVARNERLGDDRCTNAAILEIMEIAATNTGRGDFDKRLAQLPFAQFDRARSLQKNRSAQPEIYPHVLAPN